MAIVRSKREGYSPEHEERELRAFTLIELLVVATCMQGQRRLKIQASRFMSQPLADKMVSRCFTEEDVDFSIRCSNSSWRKERSEQWMTPWIWLNSVRLSSGAAQNPASSILAQATKQLLQSPSIVSQFRRVWSLEEIVLLAC